MRYQSPPIKISVILLLLLSVTAPFAYCDEKINLFDLDLVDLMQMEVISASKHKQNITQSPNAISVTTPSF